MAWLLATRGPSAHHPFSWRETHDEAAYSEIFLVPSNGVVFWDRWIWLATGVCVFLFFGFGREAVGMYRTALLTVGVGRIWPGLKREAVRRPTGSTMSSMESRAKMLFRRKDSSSRTTWTSRSDASTSPSRSHLHSPTDGPISPKTATFLEAIREVPQGEHAEKGAPPQVKPSLLSRLTSWFHLASIMPRKRSSAPVPLAELTNEDATVRSTVSAGQRSGSLVSHMRHASADVWVKKEVRQGSEHT